ncbi:MULTISPECIES: hypothetical protein [unclassified Exiguobacterium]|uniref:hypothetical protein n=1 Tax=unclassified Exiguobacterium TaxID=2644629 RepID=UPI001BE7F417|nr:MULTISPECIES: hypothetical protein [unclassified Exiguobacterium]
MKNQYMLIDYNKNVQSKIEIKFNSKLKVFEYKLNQTLFDGAVIRDILYFVNNLEQKFGRAKLPVYFDLGLIEIKDKLTYIIFECICEYLIRVKNRKVLLNFKADKNIVTDGIASSPLKFLSIGYKPKNKFEIYGEKFKKEIQNSHYRRLIAVEEEEDPYLLSKIMGDIDSFLKPFNVNKDNRHTIAEVITELVGNALEHTKTDCLIDLDVASDYVKEKEPGNFYGLNITIVNFSNQLLGHSISQKLKKIDILNERHLCLLDAFQEHKRKFDNDYIEEDFYNIASFQHKITGRAKNETTGGTGLTKLIQRLEKQSDDYSCYMISGKRALFFHHEYLFYNEDNWIGFNNTRDFFNEIPNERTFGPNNINMPGTAYNLHFVMKVED